MGLRDYITGPARSATPGDSAAGTDSAASASAVGIRKPRPLASLTSAASRLATRRGSGAGVVRMAHSAAAGGWQGDAWDAFDQVGEQRFLATTIGNRMGQAKFFVGRVEDGSEDPEPLVEGLAAELFFRSFQRSPAALAQMITRAGTNLFVAGEFYLVGIPSSEIEAVANGSDATDTRDDDFDPDSLPGLGVPDEVDLGDMEWRVLSRDEIETERSDSRKVLLRNAVDGHDMVIDADRLFIIRTWRPHPRRWWEPDSPTRSSLPVLRELIGLTMQVSAQVDSRLAGAGLLLVPNEADAAMKAAAHSRVAGQEEPPDFVDDLMETMITPISDRSSASAVVPMVVTVPGETIGQFRHISFSTPLDDETRELRDEAIRRLALGQDAPPEILLGSGDASHWGAWLVREDVVTTHIEPPLALVCDALTTQFLWPVLEQLNMDRDEVRRHVIWYDVEHMIIRPNRSSDALALHDKGLLSPAAARLANGFDENDAPTDDDPAVTVALQLIAQAPSLLAERSLPELVAEIRTVMGARPGAALPAPGGNGSGRSDRTGETEGDIPRTSGDPMEVPPPPTNSTDHHAWLQELQTLSDGVNR